MYFILFKILYAHTNQKKISVAERMDHLNTAIEDASLDPIT